MNAPGGRAMLEYGDVVHLQSPLHVAVRYGHFCIVKALLDADANPSLVDSSGKSSLHMAACLGPHDQQAAETNQNERKWCEKH